MEGTREKARIHFLPHSPPDNHHSDDHLLNRPLLLSDSCSLGGGAHSRANQWLSTTTNSHSMTVVCLGEGPTVVPTNGTTDL